MRLPTDRRERVFFIAATPLNSRLAPSHIYGGLASGRTYDRIQRGASPAELPVEGPKKVLMVINLKAAKAIDLPIPPSMLAKVDEVIQ